MSKCSTITIDGFSSCGKSSLAKQLAAKIGYAYVDSGAMYRAVSLYCIQQQIDISRIKDVTDALDHISIRFKIMENNNHCFLNGIDVETKIRTLEVANIVSQIAAISSVRSFLVTQQRLLGTHQNIVMDGRDIGTVVFPDAELKIFLTAEPKIRVLRRYEEMINKGMDTTVELITKNLQHRDHIDSTRADSPLRKAEDAITLDNSYLSREEQLDKAFQLFQKCQNS